ncbi:MAG: tRNA (adenosine(37)-N6)-threonylcarbamoyltransferase complex dimerization subunit type 1 TsaB [Ignavibacteria bacterium]
MKILFLDTSSKISETALFENDIKIFHSILKDSDGADQVVYNLRECFKKFNIDPSSIDLLSLSNGPGSFTGLRIGSAIAKGICFVNGSEFIEIPTLDILANIVPSENNITSLIPSNPKTAEFYFAKYEKNGKDLNRTSDLGFGNLHDILKNESKFIIKKEALQYIPESFQSKFYEYSDEAIMKSQYDLTLKKVSDNDFSNVENSTPVYLRQFIPKN